MSADTPRRTTAQERLPKRIGPYFIRERIGKGAMGVVYRATDDSGRLEVALKVMASDLDGDPETRERFFREAHVAGKLRHPNIVSVRDSGEDNGRLYIAMELLRGATLTDVLKAPESLDLEDRIDVMIQVCQGLTVAHAAGVFHRDLKPANLFVCEDRRVKILDFGVARLVGSNMTLTGNIIGTPDFMSPEQVRGADIDGRSDIFSAGSVFYLLLTGRKPFAANDLPAVLNKVVRAQPLPIRDTEAPEALAAVIRKALAKDPAARQQEVRELACELMAAATEVARKSHQQAISVRRSAMDLIRLGERARELASNLQLPNDALDPWAAIQEGWPILRGGVNVLGTFPVRSRVVQELHDAVKAHTDALTGEVNSLEEAYAKYTSGTALQQNGAHEHALKEFDAARRLAPASPVISAAVEQCADALQKIRERDAELQARITLATEAAERADWETVLAVAKELDELNANSPVIARLREDAARQLEAQRLREAQTTSGRTTAAVPNSSVRSSGRHNAAAPGTMGDPPPPSDRTVRGAQLRQQAVRALIANDLLQAEQLASEAVTHNGADREARHLLERVRAALALRTTQEENRRRVLDLLGRATSLADNQQFTYALALCDEALQLDPTHVDAIATQARIAELLTAHEATRAVDEASERRVRAATPALTQARRAFEEGDLERARWCAENALALAPEWPDAQAFLAQVVAALPEPSPDDTVKLGDPHSDETAELAPYREVVPDTADDRSSNWSRLWRSIDAQTKG